MSSSRLIKASDHPVVALFGGSFDPPHKAHAAIPTFLLAQKMVDQVWYVPVKNHPFGKTLSSDQDRVRMIQLCIDHSLEEHPQFVSKIRIETCELDRNTTSYTIQTLDELAARHPETSFRWVIGNDNLAKFHLWGKEAARIPAEYGMFVYPRAGHPPAPLLPGMTFLSEAPEVNVSSSEVRELAQGHQSLSGAVLPDIETYIIRHQLYQ